ncbi:MAG: dimethylaniline monooxygenase (N-oxide forming) [Cryomorphaceae bacterium]|jgi:dimethylaniline monooxygenase (N-oxide forming)
MCSDHQGNTRKLNNNEMKIAVIGAGPCGLAASKALKEFGLGFECLEAGERVGGVWNVESGGNGYRSLRTNTSTGSMAFSDFPFEAGSPLHPSADEMAEYFRKYAEHFSIIEHIKFNTRVKQVTPNADNSWQIEFGNGATEHYSNVIVATGRYAKPKLPDDQSLADFEGQVFHSSDYLDVQSPVDFRGKRVVVVGLGSSAAEIASDLADKSLTPECATRVVLSVRSGRWVIPKIIDGKPADAAAPHPSDQLPMFARMMPNSVGVWLMRRVLGKIFRHHFELQQALLINKLPKPDIKPWADRPTLSSDFVPLLQSGDIEIRPSITKFRGSTVCFSDATEFAADGIIYATGYTAEIPFISEQVLGCGDDELTLYQQIAHPEQAGLFFVGYSPVLCSMWPLAEQQSRWIARLLSKAFTLPDERVRKRKAIRLKTALPIICGFYVAKLRKEAKGLDRS